VVWGAATSTAGRWFPTSRESQALARVFGGLPFQDRYLFIGT